MAAVAGVGRGSQARQLDDAEAGASPGGLVGGKARAEKLSAEERSEISNSPGRRQRHGGERKRPGERSLAR